MIWIILFVLFFIAAGIGFIYLSSRFYKFRLIEKFSKENKKLRIIFSILPLILFLIIGWLTIGWINSLTAMLHLVIFWLFSDFLFWIIRTLCKKSMKYYYAGAAAILITAVYLSAGAFSAHHIWQTHYTIETEKNVGDLRIIQFADSHVGTTFSGNDFSKHVKDMQAQNPDIVVITGDFIDDDTSKEDMLAACKALGNFDTAYGVYFAFGNHDKGYFHDPGKGYGEDDLIAELEKNHVQILQDESVLIDGRFYVIGRQDRSNELRGNAARASMSELIEHIDTEKFMIVLDHQPHDYEQQTKSEVDLVLSGHTHGGQLFPGAYVMEWEWLKFNDKAYGHEKRAQTDFIVTSGISDWALTFKTGCKSEYVVINIKGH